MTVESTAPRRSGSSPRWPLFILWIALSIALLVSVRVFPWERVLDQLRRIEAAWVLVAVVSFFVILPLWAIEWRLLSPRSARVSFRAMFEVVAVTASVLNSVPFFAGEAAGVGLLIARAGLARGAALSVLALDQLLVGFAKLVVVAAAAAFAPLPVWVRGGLGSLVAGVGGLFLALLALAHRGAALRDQLLGKRSRLQRFLGQVASFGVHLEALRDPHRGWQVVLLALAKKGVELFAIIAVQLAFGLEPSISVALLVLAALAVTTLLPVTPANLGVYEATVFATYRITGTSPESALGLAIVQHLCFLLPMLVTGYVALTVRQLVPQRAPAA